MKRIGTMMSALTLMLILSSSLLAQSVGDYRTRASGNWSVAQNWQRYNGASWVNVGTPPTGAETITVLSTDSIFVNVAVSITGKLVNQGIVEPSTNLTIANGGTYQHDRDGGRVPLATWGDGSTMLVTGVTAVAPNDRDQDYYNLTFNTPGLASNLNMNLNRNTIRGDVRVINTGVSRWYLMTTVVDSTATVTIMGDVIVEGGQFSVQGTSNARTTFIVHHYGNIVVTGGNFSVARGSQGSGSGSTRWYLHEGNFSMSNATTQNSNAANARFVFDKQGTQTLTLGAGNTLTALPIEVSSGTTLNMGTSVLAGSGIFTLNAGATLASGHPNGINGNLQITGNTTLNKKASFTFNGVDPQVPGALLPDSINVLTVSNAKGVSFNDTLRSSELLVSSGAVIKIDTLGSLTADSGSVAGTIVNKGVLASNTPLTFAGGSVYEHARDGGNVPTAVWKEGSTTLFTGITGTAPGNRGQDYYNLTLNTPGLSSNRDLNLQDHTIGGDITVISTGSVRWQLVGSSSGTVKIMGDVIVQAGQFTTQGTSSATNVVIDHYGSVVVTGGNFSVARGSQGNGSGSTRWYLHDGNFSMSNATTQNSNAANAWFVFDKKGTQTLTLGAGNTLTALPIEVKSGTTLNMGASVPAGSGIFTLNQGATLVTSLTGGIDELLKTVTGTVTLTVGSSYGFSGTTIQVTSPRMPAIVTDLIIDNPIEVTLSQPTTINGVLRLKAGVFDNAIPFTLGPNGSISYEGGRLKFTTAVDEQSPEIPTEFALLQNYPNPFNPSTTIHYDLPKRAHVSLKIYDIIGHLVADLVNGEQEAGAYNLVWDAQGLTSGVYYYKISAGDFTSVRKLILMK